MYFIPLEMVKTVNIMLRVFYHQNNYKRKNSNLTLENLADAILMKWSKITLPVFQHPVPPDMMSWEA